MRSSVVRLGRSVHGEGDTGFVGRLVEIVRGRGVSGYIGDWANRCPAVQRLDAARLFHLALENAPAGSIHHAVADEGVPVRDSARVIGRHLDLPVVSIGPEDADGHFGWLAPLLAAYTLASNTLTRDQMGWQPTHPGLIDDLDRGHYFRDPSA